MKKIEYDAKFFNVKDTLECGQIFRFRPFEKGFLVFSGDKACYAYNEGSAAYVVCEDGDDGYFYNFFDLERDYCDIYSFARSSKFGIVQTAAESASGVRILNQGKQETLFSFLTSQNNHIPRIKSIIERTCTARGKKKSFFGEDYYAFPSAEELYDEDIAFYNALGYGYRSDFIRLAAEKLKGNSTALDDLSSLTTECLKHELMRFKGVGPKVADCVSLFAYHRTDAFPVDTWIEKLYREDFCGEEKDRNKISEFFVNEFGDNSGYVQQYVFYYKRGLRNETKIN